MTAQNHARPRNHAGHIQPVISASPGHTLGIIQLTCAIGLAYGFLFGVFPSLIANTFGVAGLSQNWGMMTIAPVIFGNIFNLIYGSIYDSKSVISRDGTRDCREGLDCECDTNNPDAVPSFIY